MKSNHKQKVTTSTRNISKLNIPNIENEIKLNDFTFQCDWKMQHLLNVMMQCCKSTTGELEAGGSQEQGQPRLHN